MNSSRELRRAWAQVRTNVQGWVLANPRKDGESLRDYRRRCREALSATFEQKYTGETWVQFLAILLEILKLIIPLLIR